MAKIHERISAKTQSLTRNCCNHGYPPSLKDHDRLILDWSTAANLPAIILLTKADKLGVTARSKALKEVKLLLSEFDGNFTVIPFSAWSGIGIDETRKLLSMWYSSFQPIEENENV